jgi:hypothetical protein
MATEIWTVEMGHVSHRKGARLHLAVDGRSYCPSGSRVIIETRMLRDSDAPIICKRCRAAVSTRVAIVLDQRRMMASPGRSLAGVRGNLDIITAAEGLIDALRTPAEVAEIEAMRASLRADLSTTRGAIQVDDPRADVELALF